MRPAIAVLLLVLLTIPSIAQQPPVVLGPLEELGLAEKGVRNLF